MHKITHSVERALADRGADVATAAGEGHSINIGPGEALEREWTSAGLTLPDLDAMRRYRLERVQAQLAIMGYDGAILRDPMNIRYATDSTNMQIWVMHNPSRYAWVGADGSLIVWDFFECEFLAAHNPLVQEVRPAISSFYFLAGPRYREKAAAWSDEMLDVINEHCGPNARVAIDRCSHLEYQHLANAGIQIEDNGISIYSDWKSEVGPLAAKACLALVVQELLAAGVTDARLSKPT